MSAQAAPFEPLVIADEDRVANLLELVHRTVERQPNHVALYFGWFFRRRACLTDSSSRRKRRKGFALVDTARSP